MAQRRIVLVRHGETTYNATGRMQGQLDTELSEVGIAQAKAAALEIAGWNVSAVISSDLKRAVHTAELLSAGWDVDVQTDPRLRETRLGEWTGASHAEIDRDYPGQRVYWRHDPEWAPPGAETRLEVASRAHQLVEELMESDIFDRGTVVLVAHGGTIGALTRAAAGAAENALLHVLRSGQCALVTAGGTAEIPEHHHCEDSTGSRWIPGSHEGHRG